MSPEEVLRALQASAILSDPKPVNEAEAEAGMGTLVVAAVATRIGATSSPPALDPGERSPDALIARAALVVAKAEGYLDGAWLPTPKGLGLVQSCRQLGLAVLFELREATRPLPATKPPDPAPPLSPIVLPGQEPQQSWIGAAATMSAREAEALGRSVAANPVDSAVVTLMGFSDDALTRLSIPDANGMRAGCIVVARNPGDAAALSAWVDRAVKG